MNSNNTSNMPEFSVSELSQSLKKTVENAYGYVRVRGEVSGFKRATSGHLYMALKDSNSLIDAVCWRGQAARLGVEPEDGLEVIVTGKITTYPGRSKYQIIIDKMEIAGEGALLKLLQDRKKKLLAEGLFDDAKKQKIPYLPKVIGVITSPTGAVFSDIIHRLNDRFPRHVILWPVSVQGDNAASEIITAINSFNAVILENNIIPDLIIIARGGGSLEDLWCFNDEMLVRAVVNSKIPIISAIGHETDTSLVDFASDKRAPTPTAAAEMAVPVRIDLMAQLSSLSSRTVNVINMKLKNQYRHIENLSRGLPNADNLLANANQRLDGHSDRLNNAINNSFLTIQQRLNLSSNHLLSPAQILSNHNIKLDNLNKRMRMAVEKIYQIKQMKYISSRLGYRLHDNIDKIIERRAYRLSQIWRNLENLSHIKILKRGFALVRNKDGDVIKSSSAIRNGDNISIMLGDQKPIDAIISGNIIKKTRINKKIDDRQQKLL